MSLTKINILQVNITMVFILRLKFEIMISFIKSINPDVTIFTSACVTLSIRVELYTVNRSKMSFESGKFLVFINHVEETGIKFANFGRCSCDIHGLLTSTEDNMLIYWRNTSTVHGSICLVSFQASLEKEELNSKTVLRLEFALV